MIETKTSFFSEGHQLQATVYRPDSLPTDRQTHPALVINSGYQGFNSFYPKMFAQRFTELGYICLGFDYRGMADSEGEKGRVLIEEQVQDVRNAVSFLAGEDDVDPAQIGLVGWGMGAANVVLAAEKGKNVAAVAALNGFYNGDRWMRSIRSYDEYRRIVADIAQDRISRVRTGESRLGETFEHYPLDPATDDYVAKELSTVYGFGHPTRVQFTESILDLNVEQVVGDLRVPLFIGHGKDNTLHPFAEAEGLFAAARSPKTLYTIDGRHNDFMFVDHPVVIELCQDLKRFFDAAFEQASAPVRSVTA